MVKVADELNHGYISHNRLVYTFYRIIDFCGYRLFKPKPLAGNIKCLLFINLGLIGDLIIFRFVIDHFLQSACQITVLIRDEYKFLFNDLPANVEVITLKDYKEKKILSGLCQIIKKLKQHKQKYDVSFHFRGYLGTGILSTYLSRMTKYLVGYPTSGFGFLLNHKLDWEVGMHESQHLIKVIQVIQPGYSAINLNCYKHNLTDSALLNYNLSAKNYIVIQATSQNPAKNIPQPVLRYTLEYLLHNTSLQILFVGVANEKLYIQDCISDLADSFAPRLKLIFAEKFFMVYSLIAWAKFFIGVDSSLAHISGGLDIPKIIYWHKLNLYSQWYPLGNNFYFLNNEADDSNQDNDIIRKLLSEEIINDT